MMQYVHNTNELNVFLSSLLLTLIPFHFQYFCQNNIYATRSDTLFLPGFSSTLSKYIIQPSFLIMTPPLFY